MNVIMAISVLLVYGVFARDVKFTKKIDPGALQSQLKSSGFVVDYIDCSLDNCTIHLAPAEKKDPMPIVEKYVYVDPAEVRRKKIEEIRSLYVKLKSGTISIGERDELLNKLVEHVFGF